MIWLPPVNGAPNELTLAITRRYKELEDVHMWSAMQLRLYDFMKPGMESHIEYHTVFVGSVERKLTPLGAINVHSVGFEYLKPFFDENIRPNVLIAEVSEPDEEGNVCFGPTGGAANYLALPTAKKVILQVNPNVPFIYGVRNSMKIQDADFICYSEEDLVEISEAKEISDIDKKIAGLILNEIEDGSCIQLGIGALS